MAIDELIPIVGTAGACRAVGRPRASWYRQHRQSPLPPRPPRPAPRPQPRALSAAEQAQVLEVLHAERFVDQAPASVCATLLDEGIYLASVSTMYRLLRERGRDRRSAPPRHPPAPGQARAGGHRAQPVLVVGHHQAGRAGQVDLVLPVRDLGHLQPLCGRLDGRPPRGRCAGRAAAGRDRHRPAGAGGHADHPCRPGRLDDLQAGRDAAGRPGRHQKPRPSARP